MNVILFDDVQRSNLLPFAYTRPVADIRVGIFTIREKWENHFNCQTSSYTLPYLAEKFPILLSDENWFVNSSVLPSEKLIADIKALQVNEKLFYQDNLIAVKLTQESFLLSQKNQISLEKLDLIKVNLPYEIEKINFNWDIFQKNAQAIQDDYNWIVKQRLSQSISDTNKFLGTDIFIEEGAKVECSILNSESGPIYIGKNAEVMEGSMIRGPFSLGESATVKMGAKIYGATTIGPHCKVGGEISNCVFFGYSNKGHDGFLGNSVVGEWCNLGADTNTSNLKNNYSEIKIWNYLHETYINSGLQFCGMMMGDHSKSGINTMFNTGTIIGVFANIFGGDFPPKFIPSYSWGGANGFKNFDLEKAFDVAERVMERRNIKLTKADKKVYTEVFKASQKFRLNFK
jgi:UDP-N-acetylglucosamine diphosphorylase/glucosamine-1-phosphate N-acetyltransferase